MQNISTCAQPMPQLTTPMRAKLPDCCLVTRGPPLSPWHESLPPRPGTLSLSIIMYLCKTTFPPTSGTDHVLSDVAAGVLHGAAGALGCVIYVTVMFLDLDVRQPVHTTQLLWLLTWVLVMVVTVTSCRLLAWLPPELRVPHPDTTACTLASQH